MSGLEGEGKPLPKRYAPEDPALEAGHRIMAEAGAVPREFALKAELDAAKAEYVGAPKERKKALMAKIADLEMRYALEREAYRCFMK